MGPHPSARVLLAVAAVVLCGCNALLGTPEPELAPEGGEAADAASEADATVPADATARADALGLDAPADTAALDVVVDAASEATPAPLPPSCADAGGPGILGLRYGRGELLYEPPRDGRDVFAELHDGTGRRADRVRVPGERERLPARQVRGHRRPVPSVLQRVEDVAAAARLRDPRHLRDGGGLQQIVDGATTYEPGWNASWTASMSQSDGGGAGHWDNNLLLCLPESTWTNAPSTQENLPINCINWYEAYAFCIWDGGFLPSEAEWGYAAAGGDLQREYAWGSADPGLNNQYAIYGCDYPDGGQPGVDAAGTCNSVANIAPVGSAPLGAGRWQQLDLGGSVHEPLFDWFNATFPGPPCGDCAELAVPPGPSPSRSARGGSWWVQRGAMLGWVRLFYPPSSRDFKGGVRCARAP